MGLLGNGSKNNDDNMVDEIDEDEIQELVVPEEKPKRKKLRKKRQLLLNKQDQEESSSPSFDSPSCCTRFCRCLCCCFKSLLFLSCCIGCFILGVYAANSFSLVNELLDQLEVFISINKTDEDGVPYYYDKQDGILKFTCPAVVGPADNIDYTFDEDYDQVSQQLTDNMTEFLETFRETKFDAWGKPYYKVKKKMYDWKAQYFVEYLQDGSSIYESACGIGLNLFMTLEILNEVKNISNLVIYGNEYVASSAAKANKIFDEIAPFDAKKGTICAGDSANLKTFVPSNAFDLVYTGYITSLSDPLSFNETVDENFEYYDELCDANDTDWKANKLLQVLRQKQEDWFGNWVNEMIRIAKPGAPVIIEQVVQPYCNERYDWDGVEKEWWITTAPKRYNWDIDINSIKMEDDLVFGPKSRYHVFMLKQQK